MPGPDVRADGWPRGTARFACALVAVTLAATAFAIAFRGALGLVYRAVYHADTVVDAIRRLPLWLRILVPAAGAGIAGLLARVRRRQQGVSNVMEAVALGHVRLSFRTTLSRVAASWAALAAGLSVGREGPLIEFGGSAGALIGRAMQTPLYDTRVLVAAGTAAGFAAAYNTPFAAVLFVLETIVGIAALEAMLPMMFSSMLAAFLTRTVVGGGPLYGQRAFALTSPAELLSYAALGCVAAGLGIAFKKALAICERAFERQALVQPWRAVAGGLIVGLIAVAVPDVAGNGYEPLNLLLDHPFGSTAIVLLMVAKMAATSSAVASGVPGGIFTPSLLVGGAAGVLWARVAAPLFMPATPDAGSCALVGMAAMTAAITHAPLTAAVMIFEVSGDYPVVLPLMLATVAATAVSRRLRSDSVYEAELRRRGIEWRVTLEGRQVLDDVPD